jgi:branched-chain amino acid transport system substrate-binding protein
VAIGLLLVVGVTACGDDGAAPEETVATTTTSLGPDEGDGTLRIGTALPTTDAGQAQAVAVGLAVDDVNADGGVLDEDVELVDGIDGADVVIGVDGTDGHSADEVTAAGSVWIAPSGPDGEPPASPRLAFRTGPSAELVARATAELVTEDGATTAAVLDLDGDGPGALDAALADLGVQVVDAPTLEAVVTAEPDAVLLTGAGDAAPALDELVTAGYTPGDHAVYLVDTSDEATVGQRLDGREGVLEGAKVVHAGAEATGDLRDRLADLSDLTGAPEAYDAVVIAALAAEVAQTDDADLLAHELAGVTRSGATCTSFGECRSLIADGEDVDFDGEGGTYALGVDGHPTEGIVAVLEFGADDRYDPNRTEYRVATMPG